MRVGGTLLTVFSSSCNDDEGDGAAILVNDGKLKAIILKPI